MIFVISSHKKDSEADDKDIYDEIKHSVRCRSSAEKHHKNSQYRNYRHTKFKKTVARKYIFSEKLKQPYEKCTVYKVNKYNRNCGKIEIPRCKIRMCIGNIVDDDVKNNKAKVAFFILLSYLALGVIALFIRELYMITINI